MPMIAGPSRATKNTNWANTIPDTNFGPTASVGSVNQWCSGTVVFSGLTMSASSPSDMTTKSSVA